MDGIDQGKSIPVSTSGPYAVNHIGHAAMAISALLGPPASPGIEFINPDERFEDSNEDEEIEIDELEPHGPTAPTSSSTNKRGRSKTTQKGKPYKRIANSDSNRSKAQRSSKDRETAGYYEALVKTQLLLTIFNSTQLELEQIQLSKLKPKTNQYLIRAIQYANVKNVKRSVGRSWDEFKNNYLNTHVLGMQVSFAQQTQTGHIPGRDFAKIFIYYLFVVVYPGYSELKDKIADPQSKKELDFYMAIGELILYHLVEKCSDTFTHIIDDNSDGSSSGKVLSQQDKKVINKQFRGIIVWFTQIYYCIYNAIPHIYASYMSFVIMGDYIINNEKAKLVQKFDQADTALVIIKAFGSKDRISEIVEDIRLKKVELGHK